MLPENNSFYNNRFDEYEKKPRYLRMYQSCHSVIDKTIGIKN
jgi:hypothetical protein